jgi:prevent-host-death family protein
LIHLALREADSASSHRRYGTRDRQVSGSVVGVWLVRDPVFPRGNQPFDGLSQVRHRIVVAQCYGAGMGTTISQRELRNNSADVMRRLQAGESFTLTSNGKPIGSLTPASRPTGLPITRPATTRDYDGFPLRPAGDTPTSTILDELRGDRL